MSTKILFLVLSVIGASSVKVLAKTQKNRSVMTESIYAPIDGDSEWVLTANMVSGAFDALPAGQKVEFGGGALNFSYGYGVGDYFTIYLGQEYDSLTYEYSNPTSSLKSSGIGNTVVGIKGVIGSDFFFYYNIDRVANLLSKSEINNDTGEATPASVRPRTDVEIAFGIPISSITTGASLGLNLYGSGNVDTITGGVKTTSAYESGSGITTKLFLQYNSGWILGAAYEKATVISYAVVSNGTRTYTSDSELSETKIYTVIPISSVDLLLSVSGVVVNKPSNIVSTVTNTTVGIRSTF